MNDDIETGHPDHEVGDAGNDDLGTDHVEQLPPGFRYGALAFGIAFVVLGLTAVSLDPSGFDADAIVLWPVTLVVLGLATVAALIGAAARRFQ